MADETIAEHWHGTSNGYTNRGCRCSRCCAANTTRVRRYRARIGRLNKNERVRRERLRRGFVFERLVIPGTLEQKSRARKAVSDAVRDGLLVASTSCQICGRECKTDAHHSNYTKVLDVIWACRRCHISLHCRWMPPGVSRDV